MATILPRPPRAGWLRRCPACRRWFALGLCGVTEHALVGPLKEYRCRRCGHSVTFASRYPPRTVRARD